RARARGRGHGDARILRQRALRPRLRAGRTRGAHRRRARPGEEADGRRRPRAGRGVLQNHGRRGPTDGVPQPMRPLRTGLLWAALVAGCTSTEAPLDPSLAPLPTLEEVDDRFARHIVGPDMRQRALYEADSPVKGAAEPLVTIVEYRDFQCQFCGRFAATLDELLVAYPDDVRIVFMQFPLPMHPKAEGAAKAAIAAGQQRRFWAMHDRLF